MAKQAKSPKLWRPPGWIPLAFTAALFVLLVAALLAGLDWHAASLVSGLFALCFRTTFRR